MVIDTHADPQARVHVAHNNTHAHTQTPTHRHKHTDVHTHTHARTHTRTRARAHPFTVIVHYAHPLLAFGWNWGRLPADIKLTVRFLAIVPLMAAVKIHSALTHAISLRCPQQCAASRLRPVTGRLSPIISASKKVWCQLSQRKLKKNNTPAQQIRRKTR